MDEDTLFFTGIVVVFAVVLGLEWRYGFKSLRVGAAIMALALLLFLQPHYHAAWRRAISTPESERVSHWSDTSADSSGPRLTEYQSGVFTMRRAVIDLKSAYSGERWFVVGVLFWLACSPVFRRSGGPADERTRTVNSSDAAPEA